MRKSTLLILSLVALTGLAVAVLLFTRKGNTPKGQETIRVVASITPIADIASHLAQGTDIEVSSLLPAGASPHTFEPAPDQILRMQGAKLMFVIGHGLDNWADALPESVNNMQKVVLDKGIILRDLPLDQRDQDEPDQSVDPHYWLDPTNAKLMARTMADEMSNLDPKNRQVIAANLVSYENELDTLDSYIKNRLSSLTSKAMITHHNAWGYFADRYGLKIVGTFEVSPGKEPDPRQISELQTKVKEYGISTIFTEPQLSEQAIEPFTRDLNLKTAVLDPEGGLRNMGYIDMMRYNADTLASALK